MLLQPCKQKVYLNIILVYTESQTYSITFFKPQATFTYLWDAVLIFDNLHVRLSPGCVHLAQNATTTIQPCNKLVTAL